MFALFIYVVLSIGLMATVAYTLFSVQQTADIAAQTTSNTARLETVVFQMKGLAGPVVLGGPIRPPVGRNAGDPSRHVLPESFVGSDTTPWGAPYGWCPVLAGVPTEAEASLASETVEIAGEPSYQASVVTTSDGRRRLLPNDASPPVLRFDGDPSIVPDGILGFVVSPPSGRHATPSCSEIAFRDGAFVVGGRDLDGDGLVDAAPTNGGTASPVYADSAVLRLGVQQERSTIFVSPFASGNGDGSTRADATTLSGALSWWETSGVQNAVFQLASGDYPISGAVRIGSGSGRSLTIDGPGARFVSASSGEVSFGSQVEVVGLETAQDVGLRVVPGSRVTFSRAVMSRLRVDGGDVVLTGGSSIGHAGGDGWHALEITSGSVSVAQDVLRVSESVPGLPAIMAVGGSIFLNGSDLDVGVGPGTPPWSITAPARIDPGLSRTNSRPTVSWGGQTVPVTESSTVRTDCSASHACLASCPVLTYPISGGCAAEGNAPLVSASVQGTGYSCRWAAEAPSGAPDGPPFVALPAPATSVAEVSCSASEPRGE